jgi:hypothetical protein
MASIYAALKRRGFHETYWQFVYPGQIGGLVKSPKNSAYEYHVRFFEDGAIYAELEVGRSMLLHFLFNRCYLNRYIYVLIRGDLSAVERVYFLDSTKQYKQSSCRKWHEWSAHEPLLSRRGKRTMRVLHGLSDWRVLFIAMACSVAAAFGVSGIGFPLLAIVLIFIYLMAPKRR